MALACSSADLVMSASCWDLGVNPGLAFQVWGVKFKQQASVQALPELKGNGRYITQAQRPDKAKGLEDSLKL